VPGLFSIGVILLLGAVCLMVLPGTEFSKRRVHPV
jgi:hypothetical protein